MSMYQINVKEKYETAENHKLFSRFILNDKSNW